MMLLFLLFLCVVSHLEHPEPNEFHGHKCIHSELMKDMVESVGEVQYRRREGRSLPDWEPIRIHVNMDAVVSNKAFFTKILNAAVTKLSAILSVDPALSPIKPSESSCYTFFDYPQADIDGSGYDEKDFVVYVESITGTCSSGTLAYAVTCQRDGKDRPTIGYTNMCPNGFDPANEGNEFFEDHYAGVMAHELSHALGFSETAFDGNRFIDPSDDSKLATVTNTFSERGTTVKKIVTAQAIAKAREYFDCDTLNGVELEDYEGQAGSHMEMRIYPDDFMAGIASNTYAISSVSMAILESSGWYSVDYTKVDRMYYGKGAGCKFAYEEKCLTKASTPVIESWIPEDTYCNEDYDAHNSGNNDYRWTCTPCAKGKGYCITHDYVDDVPEVNIPSYNQYWSSNVDLGGAIEETDFCPYFRAVTFGTTKMNCWNADSSTASLYGTGNNWGEFTGEETSRCFHSRLVDEDKTALFAGFDTRYTGMCFNTQCNYDGDFVSSISVYHKRFSGTQVTSTCTTSDAGSQKTVTGFDGHFLCPDLVGMKKICPDLGEAVDCYDNCTAGTCENGGCCLISDECSCAGTGGYTGATCTGFSCTNGYCQNGGECDAPQHCDCTNAVEGYTGSACSQFECEEGCENGECTAPNNCTCDDNYTGDDCSIYLRSSASHIDMNLLMLAGMLLFFVIVL